MRKVANRLAVLEERYKDLSPKQRASKINEELMQTFCVGKNEIIRWKQIVNVAKSHITNIGDEKLLQPSHYIEIAKLPEEKQSDIIEKVANENLTYQQTALLVQQILGKNEFKPQIYNVWNFNGCDDKYGKEGYIGRTPGQIVENVVYYFTEENDLVVDPMAGSGTTIDVCNAMNRKCLAYDLNTCRDDIKQNDVSKGLPNEAKGCKLIYLDPPYYNMVFKNLYASIDEFRKFVHKLADVCFDTLTDDGFVTLLMQDMTELGNYCLSGDCFCIFICHGFECVGHISVPLTTENFLPQQVEKAKREKRMLGRNRDLYIFQKQKVSHIVG